MDNIIETKINQYAVQINKSIKDLSILLSFSAGLDSTVLSSLMIELKDKYDFRLHLMHLNHNIHNKAKQMEQFCKKFAQINNLQFYCKQLSFNNSSNFEASAREKRYIELNNLARQLKCDIILTAHHLDDQIETLYMKELDGSDWISKIGIRESMDRIKRPLLKINKAALKIIAEERELSWIEDPTNDDILYRRNYVRNYLLPKAINKNPKLVKNLLIDAQSNKSRMKFIITEFNNSTSIFIREKTKQYLSIYLDELIKLEIEVLKIFIYWCLKNTFQKDIPERSRKFWNEFSKYLRSSNTGAKFFLGDHMCFINRKRMILTITSSGINNRPKKKLLLRNIKWYESSFCIKNIKYFKHSANRTHFICSINIFQNGLYLRRWKNADKIFSATSKKHTLVSDLFINNKLSIFDKLVQPIIVDKTDRIVWIPGISHVNIEDKYETNKMKILKWVPA